MRHILDASTAINLANGDVLDVVLRLDGLTFAIGPIVLKECGTHQATIGDQISKGLLGLASDEAIPASIFLQFLEKYELGDGETECLVIASLESCVVCCDDAAARRAVANELGRQSVSGSIGLLKEAVKQGALTPSQAVMAYEQMRVKGAFLPDLPSAYFVKA